MVGETQYLIVCFIFAQIIVGISLWLCNGGIFWLTKNSRRNSISFLCPICVRFVICFSLFRLLLKYLCGIGGIFWLTKHGRGNSIARFVSVTHWLNFSFLYSCPFPVLNSNNNTCKSSFSVFWCQNIIHSCVLSIHSLSSFDEIAWTLSIPLETSTLSGLLLPRSRD